MPPHVTQETISHLIKVLQRAQSVLFDADPNTTSVKHGANAHHLRAIGDAIGAFSHLTSLLPLAPLPQPFTANDETAFNLVDGPWVPTLIDAELERPSYGEGAARSVADALFVAATLAELYGANGIFYRGEHRYGRPLLSKAERTVPSAERGDGISASELSWLRDWQQDVKQMPNDRAADIFPTGIPDNEDPRWLAAMQHHSDTCRDQNAGTRLLDLTRSVFAGLHFATISWDGHIDTDHDGVLYIFIDKSKPWRHDAYGLLDAEGVAPGLDSAFANWPHGEYLRLYESPDPSPRELAQDGVFLVRGDITDDPMHGEGHKLRIPKDAKVAIARQLWAAGFTPKRIVRGALGEVAHANVAGQLGI